MGVLNEIGLIELDKGGLSKLKDPQPTALSLSVSSAWNHIEAIVCRVLFLSCAIVSPPSSNALHSTDVWADRYPNSSQSPRYLLKYPW